MRHKIFIAFLSLLTATSTLDMAKAQSCLLYTSDAADEL